MENLDLIKDGSTGEYINGYQMFEIAALTKNEKLPIPVYTSLFSSNETNFVSANTEYLKGLKYIKKTFGKVGIYALDRWFDDEKYFEKILVRTLNRIRTLNMLLSIVIGFIAIFSDYQKQVQ